MKSLFLILFFASCISSKKIEDNKRQQQIQAALNLLDKEPTITHDNFDSLNKIYHYSTATAVIHEGMDLKTWLYIQDSIARKNNWYRPRYDSINHTIDFYY